MHPSPTPRPVWPHAIHFSLTRRVARRVANAVVDAEDLAQEAVSRALARPHAPEQMGAYLCRSAINLHISSTPRRRLAMRAAQQHALVAHLYDHNHLRACVEPERLVTEGLSDEIVVAPQALPVGQRQAVELVDLADLAEHSYHDAAQALRIPVGTLMSRSNRGRTHLRRALSTHAQTQGVAQHA